MKNRSINHLSRTQAVKMYVLFYLPRKASNKGEKSEHSETLKEQLFLSYVGAETLAATSMW